MIFWASGIQQELGAPLPWGDSIQSGQVLDVQVKISLQIWDNVGLNLFLSLEFTFEHSLLEAVR